jgi:sugar lactone lactonase YvrE
LCKGLRGRFPTDGSNAYLSNPGKTNGVRVSPDRETLYVNDQRIEDE